MDLRRTLRVSVILVFFLMRDAMSWRNQQRPTHWWLRSHFRLKTPCKGGNLMKIDTNQCTVSNGKQKCEAKCNGWYTKHPTTSFQLVQLRRKKCIQFSDDLDRKFSLKAVNGTSVTFEKQRCTTESNFLFAEKRVGRLYQYLHTVGNTTLCLGVPGDCGVTLSLIRADGNDRRCLFRKHRKRI